MNDLECAMNDWYNFVEETETHYGVNMNVLTKPYHEEHEKYYLKVRTMFCIHFEQMNLLINSTALNVVCALMLLLKKETLNCGLHF